MKKRTFLLIAVLLNLTACANSYMTPLAKSAAEGNIAGMKQALASGAEINPDINVSASPLGQALEHNHPEAVSFLLDNGAIIRTSHIGQAVATSEQMTQIFLNRISADDPIMNNAMYFALVFGDSKVFFNLVEHGVRIPRPNSEYLGQELKGFSYKDGTLFSNRASLPKYDAMALALVGGSESIVNYLLNMPIDWRIDKPREVTNYVFGGKTKNPKVKMSLLCVWSNGQITTNYDVGYVRYLFVPVKMDDDKLSMDTLNFFAINGAAGKECVPGGRNPLTEAAQRRNSLHMVKQLIALGANPYVVNSSGSTLLHYAATTNNPELVKYLVDIGVNPKIKNNDGNTAYDMSYTRGIDSVSNILAPYNSSTFSSDIMGKLVATAGLVAVGSQVDLSSEQMTQFLGAATQDVWLNDGRSNNLAQLQQSALASSSTSASNSSSSNGINKAHGPKKPLRNQGVCKDYTIDNYKDANLIGEPQIDTLCATGIVHYRVYLANYGRNDADAKELEKVYQAHVYSMETANKVDKATQM
ncbi:ankyrin repeat domain-containing protein [Vibrio fluvialis]|nr:ankyrin repeat domain-containing protein [Vibrio fluvialis]